MEQSIAQGLVVNEHEMIERFFDGCNKAADRAKQFTVCEEQEKPQLFIDFVAALKVAAGSAHQLAHAQENPIFLGIRDTLEKVIAGTNDLVTCGPKSKGSWVVIKQSLEGIANKGKKHATSRAMSRQDVLANLDLRKIKLNAELNIDGQPS